MSKRPQWKVDLLEEETLFEAFKVSLGFPKQAGNRFMLAAGFTLSILLSILPILTLSDYDSMSPLQRMLDFSVNFAVGILGFLIAGFSIFAVVSSDKVLRELAKTQYGETEHSIFKVIFYNFLSAFVVFLTLLALSALVLLLSNLPLAESWKAIGQEVPKSGPDLVNSLVLCLLCCWIVYALVKMKSFIWGVYQAFLTMLLSRDIIEAS